MDQERLKALVAFLREEARFLNEWADDVEAGIEVSSWEELADCMNVQADLLRSAVQVLQGAQPLVSLTTMQIPGGSDGKERA